MASAVIPVQTGSYCRPHPQLRGKKQSTNDKEMDQCAFMDKKKGTLNKQPLHWEKGSEYVPGDSLSGLERVWKPQVGGQVGGGGLSNFVK